VTRELFGEQLPQNREPVEGLACIVVGPSTAAHCERCGDERPHITLGARALQCSKCGKIRSAS
jgi:hypothetical protein